MAEAPVFLETDMSLVHPMIASSPASPSFPRTRSPTASVSSPGFLHHGAGSAGERSPSFVNYEDRSASFLHVSTSCPDLSNVETVQETTQFFTTDQHFSGTFLVKNGNDYRALGKGKKKRSAKDLFQSLKLKMKKKSSMPNLHALDEDRESMESTTADAQIDNEYIEEDLKHSTFNMKRKNSIIKLLSKKSSVVKRECENILDDFEDIEEVIGSDADVIMNEDYVINDEIKTEKAEEEKEPIRTSEYFKLNIIIISGKDLPGVDKCGTSDPYVKVMQKSKSGLRKSRGVFKDIYQTQVIKRTLSPIWTKTKTNPNIKGECESDTTKEECVTYITAKEELKLEVWDWDLAGSHNYMGEVRLEKELKSIKEGVNMAMDLPIQLGDKGKGDKKLNEFPKLGSIKLEMMLKPVSKEQYEFRMNPRRVKWSGMVHVVLVQARGLLAMDDGNGSDPYCRLTLGKETQTSKVMTSTLNPKWKEAFDLTWTADEPSGILPDLHIDLFSKKEDDFIGRIKVGLKEMMMDVSYNLWRPVEHGSGQLNIIFTVSGITAPIHPSLLWQPAIDKDKLMERYSLRKTFENIKNIGHLSVRVLKAHGLNSARGGLSPNPFCVVELTNVRLQTHTEFKTLEPVWQKNFSFDIDDINQVLEVTVYHEDSVNISGLRKAIFLGKIVLPLLRIQCGGKKWFNLKKEHLKKKAKGNNPKILLEMNLHWNPIRAIAKTFEPKHEKYESKYEEHGISKTIENIRRVKAACAAFSGGIEPDKLTKEMESILNWDNKPKSAAAYLGFVLGVLFFEPWMISFGLLIPFIQNIFLLTVSGVWEKSPENAEDDDVEEAQQPKETLTLMDLNRKYQDIMAIVGGHVECLAHTLECILNVFNFSVPFLSCLGFVALLILTLVLYFVPLRIFLIFIGTHAFMKMLIRPWFEDTCELADYLSRVPDKEQLLAYKEIKEPSIDVETMEKIKRKAAQDKKII